MRSITPTMSSQKAPKSPTDPQLSSSSSAWLASQMTIRMPVHRESEARCLSTLVLIFMHEKRAMVAEEWHSFVSTL